MSDGAGGIQGGEAALHALMGGLNEEGQVRRDVGVRGARSTMHPFAFSSKPVRPSLCCDRLFCNSLESV